MARLESEYDKLTDAPKRGKSQSDPALENLIARHRKLTLELGWVLKSPDALEKHYGEYVTELVDLANSNRHRTDSYDSFRSHIARVVLRPNDEGTALLVEVNGRQHPGRGNVQIETRLSSLPA